jgi:hypothetical protein
MPRILRFQEEVFQKYRFLKNMNDPFMGLDRELRACSTCGFLPSIDCKNPDFRALLEPAR